METPTGVSGTWRCIPNGTDSEAFSFRTTGFTDNGPAGATYKYTITRAGTVRKTVTSSSKAVTVTTPGLAVDMTATQWTIGCPDDARQLDRHRLHQDGHLPGPQRRHRQPLTAPRQVVRFRAYAWNEVRTSKPALR